MLNVFALVCVLAYLASRLLFEAQMAQQNSYRIERYGRWLKTDLLSTTRITDLLMLIVLTGFGVHSWIMLLGLMLVSILKLTKETSRKSKKPLVYTARVKRILSVEAALTVIAIVLTWTLWSGERIVYVMQICVLLTPLLTVAAIGLLTPVEFLINRWYIKDAEKRLQAMPSLTVIGVTGSYGKTSTKHYLYRILSEHFSVLMTPGSFNTTMGVVRTVREQLKPYHNIFIAEMGAKQIGDVAEICKIVHPSIGIITAVGEQHLESFGSIQNVQKAKFELADALPEDGLAVLNDDFEQIAIRPVENVRRVVRYGTEGDYRITESHFDSTGTTFTIADRNGWSLTLRTTLVGRYNLSNILAGCIVARTLGMSDDEIRNAVADIRQVEHRLNMSNADGITIIDDAYNSNPYGAKMALEVLASFEGGNRVVITPGMIELGDKQEQYNRTFGTQIASSCDYAIIVGEFNRAAITAGLRDADFDTERLVIVDTLQEAASELHRIARAGDAVLYENDLPDTFK